MSLAREIVIRNMMRQRKFIQELIEKKLEDLNDDGNSTVRYIGNIFKENIEYFESPEMGFKVEKINYLNEPFELIGLSLYRIYPNQDEDFYEELTEQEIVESGKYIQKRFEKEEEKLIVPTTFEDFLSTFIGEPDDQERPDDEIEGQERIDEIIDHDYYLDNNSYLADSDDYE